MARKRGIPLNYHYSQVNQRICPDCGTTFGTPQALQAHLRNSKSCPGSLSYKGDNIVQQDGARPAASLPAPQVAAPTAGPNQASIDNRELEALVKRRRLQAELRKLDQEFPAQARDPDLTSNLGLGELDSQARTASQLAALERLGLLRPVETQQDSVEKSITSKIVDRALDGLWSRASSGGFAASLEKAVAIAQLLDIDLKNILGKILSPALPEGCVVNGLDVSRLPPQIATLVLQHEFDREARQLQREADAAKQEFWEKGIETIKSIIMSAPEENLQKIGAGVMRPFAKGREAQEQEGPAESVVSCPDCGYVNPIPEDIQPGERIACGGPGCQRTWTAQEDDLPKQPKKHKRRQVEAVVEPAPGSIMTCSSCGQCIDVGDRPVLSEIVCPSCNEQLRILEPDTPLRALEPPHPDDEGESHRIFGGRTAKR